MRRRARPRGQPGEAPGRAARPGHTFAWAPRGGAAEPAAGLPSPYLELSMPAERSCLTSILKARHWERSPRMAALAKWPLLQLQLKTYWFNKPSKREAFLGGCRTEAALKLRLIEVIV